MLWGWVSVDNGVGEEQWSPHISPSHDSIPTVPFKSIVTFSLHVVLVPMPSHVFGYLLLDAPKATHL